MTISGIGRATPAQLALMLLAGVVIEGRHRVHHPTELQRAQSRQRGHDLLVRLTGVDLGADPATWYQHLTTSEDDHGVDHPHGVAAMKRTCAALGHPLDR